MKVWHVIGIVVVAFGMLGGYAYTHSGPSSAPIPMRQSKYETETPAEATRVSACWHAIGLLEESIRRAETVFADMGHMNVQQAGADAAAFQKWGEENDPSLTQWMNGCRS